MKCLIVYAHPSEQSFTYLVKEKVIECLKNKNIEFEISDLYQMNFHETLTPEEYLREANYNLKKSIPLDVLKEQEKINRADVIIFIYPVFWSEAPAKLVGWFQRVWTYGFAYGQNRGIKQLKKALFLVTMGGDLKEELRQKQVKAMKEIMLGDRISDRALNSEMIIFDRMSREYENYKSNKNKFLNQIPHIIDQLSDI